MKKRAEFLNAIALLLGTTIGAGIFGIPYVFAKAGFLIGLINLLLLGLIILIVNLSVGEIALRTKKRHMIAGYAKKYLGKFGEYAITFSVLIGIFGAMIAYIIGEGEALSAIFGGDSLMLSLIFFVIVSAIIWFDLNAVAESDKIISIIMLFIILFISVLAFGHIDFENLKPFDFSKFLLPYGVVLFAMVGASAIPEMEGELIKQKAKLKKAIIIGTLIPLAVYLLFSFVVVGVSGIKTTEVATIGLGNALGKYMVLLGNVFAVLAMATSFISVGLAMRWMLRYDYGFSKFSSWFISCFVPLAIFLGGARSFIEVVALTGAIAGGIEGSLLVLTAKEAKKKGERKPEYEIKLSWWLVGLIMLIFLIGIVYQFLYY